MADIPLIVTPNWTFTDEVPVTTAALNAAAVPQVKFPDGPYITPANLDMAALTPPLVEAARNLSFLTNGAFRPENWETPAGITVLVDTPTENAMDWWVKSTGAQVVYARADESPSDLTAHCARVYGNTGLTLAELRTYIYPNMADELGEVSMVFSAWVYNATAASLRPTFFLRTSNRVGDLDNTTDRISQQAPVEQAIAANTWGRVQFTFSTVHTDWLNGAILGLSVGTQLDSPVKYFQVAQVQLELGTVASDYKRPLQLVKETKKEQAAEIFGPDDALTGGFILIQIKGSAERRYLGAPPNGFIKPILGWNRHGYPQWIEFGDNKEVFKCTKHDQHVTIPVTGTMRIDVWGAGGMEDVGISGGVGGYTYGVFPCIQGTRLTVVVGEGAQAKHNNIRPYGFGGKGSADGHQWASGGLSGVFTGGDSVDANDTARALIIAGGGGCGGQTGGGRGAVQGGNGNDSGSTGGESNMQGTDATGGLYGTGSGAGGWRGGGSLGVGGKGGTGYLHASHTAGTILGAVRPSLNVPGSGNDNYYGNIGKPSNPGLVVITFRPAGVLVVSTSSPLGDGTVGASYYQSLASSGGITPYTWTVTVGTLPAGLTLSTDGVISGTPTTPGSSSFTVQVQDGSTDTATKAFTIDVI